MEIHLLEALHAGAALSLLVLDRFASLYGYGVPLALTGFNFILAKAGDR